MSYPALFSAEITYTSHSDPHVFDAVLTFSEKYRPSLLSANITFDSFEAPDPPVGNFSSISFSDGKGVYAGFSSIKYSDALPEKTVGFNHISFSSPERLLPDQVVYIYPIPDTVTNVIETADFQWHPAGGATFYEGYWGEDYNDVNNATSVSHPNVTFFSTALTEMVAPTFDYLTVYYYRIDSVNVHGKTKGQVFEFTTRAIPLPDQVTGMVPLDNAFDVDNDVTLLWDPAARAFGYDVYLSKVGEPLVLVASNIPNEFFVPGTLDYSTEYQWRVDSRNTSGSTEGIVQTFTVESLPLPGKATNPVPPHLSSGVPYDVDLAWDAASGTDYYNIYIAKVGFPLELLASGIAATTVNIPYDLDYDETYIWRVDSFNVSGGTQGDVWSFTVEQIPPPGKAINPNPPHLSEENSALTNPSWDDAARATSYDIYFGKVGEPLDIFASDVTVKIFNPGRLSFGQQYQWRIDSINSTATTTGDVWLFTVTAEPDGVFIPPITDDERYKFLKYNDYTYLEVKLDEMSPDIYTFQKAKANAIYHKHGQRNIFAPDRKGRREIIDFTEGVIYNKIRKKSRP
jgi:hypothetical protein